MSTFADPRVREGAKAWVRLLVDELRPDYLNASVEMNLYADAAPGDYPNLVSLYREIRAEVKAEHPDLPVFPSFQLEQLDDLEPVREVLDAADLVAISTYPVIRAAPGVPPETRYDDLAGLGRPLAVVETGFPAFPVEGAGTTLDVDPGAQAAYVEWLGRRAATPGLELVVWFFPYDLPADLPVPDEVADVTVVFEHMGLLDTSGRERPALDAWRRARAGADPEGP
ncbi:MAG: hypothetical protein M5U14_06060 [Acidimicrobiia bacterium]|nr:hypothetical protein [Acidimicrobiia bacterium]